MDRHERFKSLLLLFLIFILVGGAIFLIGKNKIISSLEPKNTSETVSPYILFLTNPVYSFSGKVEKVSGNNIVLKSEAMLNQTEFIPPDMDINNGGTPYPTPIRKLLTYTVVITDKTIIRQPPSNIIPYLDQQRKSASEKKLTIKDIEIGSAITVNSKVDLRTLKDNTFEAVSVDLPHKQNSISGKILSVENGYLVVENDMPMPRLPEATEAEVDIKDYKVFVSDNTEISYADNLNPEKPVFLSLKDLKKGMQVTVYFDITKSNYPEYYALLIRPEELASAARKNQPTPTEIPPMLPTPAE